MHTNAPVAAPQHTVVKVIPNDKGNPTGKLADARSTSSMASSPA